jgi:hypothetical protein
MTADERTDAAVDDPRAVAALEAYLDELEAGRPPDRESFLAGHADLAPEVAACLGTLDLLHRAAAGPPDPPPRVGDFLLGRELGRGGMGVVYEAVQGALGRRVAVKVLPPAADPRRKARFAREAAAAARLDHPHVVPVYAVGEDDGRAFIAMRLVDGWSAAELVRRAKAARAAGEERIAGTEFPAAGPAYHRFVARVGWEAADGLDHAHEAGVVHRDVKPSNLLIDRDGAAWVADFGLAAYQSAPGLTNAGETVGTLRYMSPEQAGRNTLDRRTDVYSLGATLFELLTLTPPRTGTPAEMKAALAAGAVPESGADIPPGLEAVLRKAMAADPGDRYPTAAALAADLRRELGESPAVSRPRPGRWFRVGRLAVAVVGLAAGLALGWAAAGRDRGTAEVRSANRAVLVGLTADPVPPPAFVAAAAEHLDQYVAAHRNDPAWAADVAEATEHLGLARRLQGRAADAVGSYREAVALYQVQAVVPRDRLTAARLGLAEALDEAGEHAAAVAELRAAADADPTSLYPLALRLLVPPRSEPVGEVTGLVPNIPDPAERAEATALAKLRAGDPAGALVALDRGPPGTADRPVGGCVRALAERATGRPVRRLDMAAGGRSSGAVARLRAEVRGVIP